MQAIILAAGMGKRLKELTKDNTKCMVKVNDVSLIERALNSLDKLNLNKIVIVDGYSSEKLRAFISQLNVNTKIEYINNPIFDTTNNIYSLWLAKDCLAQDDTLLLESDIIFEDAVLHDLCFDERKDLALVAKYEDWMDGTCLKLNEDDSIKDFIPGKLFNENEKSEYYKTVNFYKFSKEFSKELYIPELEKYRNEFGDNEYYEAALGRIIKGNSSSLKARRLENQKWYEIDNAFDLEAASKLFR